MEKLQYRRIDQIFHQNDLAEEVARVIGYNNIAPSKVNIFKKIQPIKTRRRKY